MFDIKIFYPSITQDLSKKALNVASEYINILKSDIDVICCSRKSSLLRGFHMYKTRFVTQDANDGVKVYEAVDTCILNIIFTKYNKKISIFYPDEVLAVLKNKNGLRS